MKLLIIQRRLGWYWRLVARNNRSLAMGGEPFSSHRAARRSFESMMADWLNGRWQIEVKPLKTKRRRRR